MTDSYKGTFKLNRVYKGVKHYKNFIEIFMKRRNLFRKSQIILILAVFIPVLSAHASDGRTTKQKLEQLRQQIGQLQTEINQVKGAKSALVKDLAALDRKIGKIVRRIHQLDKKINNLQGKVANLQRDLNEQYKTLNVEKDDLAKQIVASYMMGRQEMIKILLNQQDPAKVSRAFVYYDHLNKARTENIQSVERTIAKIESLKKEISDQKRQIERNVDEKKLEMAQLGGQRVQREQLLKKVNKDLNTKSSEVERLIANENRLQKLLDALYRLEDIPEDATKTKPFSSLKGRLPWPTKGPILGRFGRIRPNGGAKWQGYLIGSDLGKPVKSTAAGRVAFSDWLRGFGLITIIDHGDGYMTLYAHNESVFKETGDWVNAGEVIAYAGNTGTDTRSGLYFEVRANGKPLNPRRWLTR